MKMSQTGLTHYLEERTTLSAQKIDHILDSGKRWSLGSVLSKGGSVFFPHTYLSMCGDQIATVVQTRVVRKTSYLE